VHLSSSKHRRGIYLALVPLLAAALALTACSSSKSGGSGGGLTTVRVSGFEKDIYSGQVMIEVANELGYYKDAGLNVKISYGGSGTALLQSVVTGAADVTYSSVVNVAKYMKQSAAIAPYTNYIAGSWGFILLVPPGSNVTDISQLSGKTIAISSTGSTTYYATKYALAQAGIDANLIAVGAAGVLPAIQTGKAQAAVQAAPASYKAIETNVAKQLLDYTSFIPDVVDWVAKPSYAKDHADTLNKLIAATMKASAKMASDKAFALQELEKYAGETPTIAEKDYAELQPLLVTNASQAELMQTSLDKMYDYTTAGGVPTDQLATASQLLASQGPVLDYLKSHS
jgi:NitT/TauT family transport system substrate-binding protein